MLGSVVALCGLGPRRLASGLPTHFIPALYIWEHRDFYIAHQEQHPSSTFTGVIQDRTDYCGVGSQLHTGLSVSDPFTIYLFSSLGVLRVFPDCDFFLRHGSSRAYNGGAGSHSTLRGLAALGHFIQGGPFQFHIIFSGATHCGVGSRPELAGLVAPLFYYCHDKQRGDPLHIGSGDLLKWEAGAGNSGVGSHILTGLAAPTGQLLARWNQDFGLWAYTGIPILDLLNIQALKVVCYGLDTRTACSHTDALSLFVWNFFGGGLPAEGSLHWPHIDFTLLLTGLQFIHLVANKIFGLCNWFLIGGTILLLAKLALELWFHIHLAQHSIHCDSDRDCSTQGAYKQQPNGESGPKSRHSTAWRHRIGLLSILLLGYLQQQRCRGEGCDFAMEVTQVPHHATTEHSDGTKQHGMQPTMCLGTPLGTAAFQQQNQVVKRSLLRAYKRALREGFSWYKGKHYGPEDFERMGCRIRASQHLRATPQPVQPADWTHCNRHHAAKRRFTMLQWNSGGLSAARLDEVKAWLVMNQVDIAVIVETRWRFDSTWSDTHWNLIHSGEGESIGKGILVLVSKRLCNANDIQWTAYATGRLVHIRLMISPRPLDILACYQHSYHPTQQCLKQRERWWNQLADAIQGVPNRHGLFVLGDFNCHLQAASGVAGCSGFRWQGAISTGLIHSDHMHFAHILRNNALLALNAWSSALGPTYVHGDQASRLDFLCVRQAYSDGEARNVRYLWKAPFLNQTEHGHVPILSTIARYWIPAYAYNRIQRVTMNQRRLSREAYLAQTPDWQHFVLQSQDHITAVFTNSALDADSVIDQMHRRVLKSFAECFPSNKVHRNVPAWAPALPTLLSKWDHRRALLKPGICNVSNVFRTWFHCTKFCILKRLHQKQARMIRKQRFFDVVQTAAQAASRHDTHRLFHIINTHAPKMPRRQIQLRNHAGQLATPLESEAILNKFVAETWKGPSNVGLSFSTPPGVPFSVKQLETALEAIPATKAVAKHCGPGVIWKQHAQFLAPLLHSRLKEWWMHNPPHIPSSWRHGWLFMIPKPSKPAVDPAALRPLALQEPIGKAVIGLLIQLATSQAYDHMILFPIWAYMCNRSTMDAIRRVSLHCAQVRKLVWARRSTPHSRAAQLPRSGLYGGIQLCLDLRRAFDGVNRQKLFCRLGELNISSSIIQLLTSWHCESVYYVQHAHNDETIPVGCGVRQGCKAAPGLWNFYMILFLHEAMNYVSLAWLQTHLTIYADDFHIGAQFETLEDFCTIQSVLGILFSVLQQFDMHINSTKSVVILKMRGSKSHTVRRQFVRATGKDEQFRIQVPGQAELWIPVKRSAKYLGVIISYDNFEDASLKHRLTLMHIGFHRLKRWLTGKHCLSVAQRFRLWQTCIFPILSYGIFATGVTISGLRQAITQLYIMLRKVVQDFSYLTRRSNLTALTRHHIPQPAHLLHGAASSLLRTVTDRSFLVPSHDLALTLDWNYLHDLLRQIEHLQDLSLETPLQPSFEACIQTAFFQCAKCDFCTSDIGAFRRHCTLIHGRTMYRTHNVNLMDFATHGLPKCQFCGHTFTTWRSFAQHVERGCQALITGPTDCILDLPATRVGALTPQVPKMTEVATRGMRLISSNELANLHKQDFGSRLLTIVADRDWHSVEKLPAACRYLSRHCIICEFSFSRCQELHQHYRLQHPDLWELAPPKGIQLTNLYSSETPCGCCGSLFRTHMCPVWSQIAALLVNGAGLFGDETHEAPDDQRRCEICLVCFDDVAQLVQHLQQEHALQGLSFNESRDSLDGSSACAHCGQPFQTMSGLKSHVVQGRCVFFNPQATAETLPVDNLWKEACLDGKFLEILRPPGHRMRLTLTCQACGKGYRRAADLALHLQSAHSRLWRRSQQLTLVLVDAYFHQQCFCNPSLGIKRGNHICLPFRQLAMCFHRLNCEPFAPMEITDQMLQATLSKQLKNTDRYRLEQLLAHRSFGELWQDMEVLHLLSGQCILCGKTHSTADLALHMREEHHCSHAMVLFYMEQFIPMLRDQNLEDFRCQLCRLIYNLPQSMKPDETLAERSALSISHLRGNCPVVLQLSLLFATLLNGSGLQHGTGGCGSLATSAGCVPGASAALAGQVPSTCTQSTAAQSSKAKRTKQHGTRLQDSGTRLSTSAATAFGVHAGSLGGETRSGDAKSSKNGSIHSFFEPRTSGSLGPAGEGNGPMEAPTGDCINIPDDATTPAFGADSSEGPEATGGTDRGEQGHRCSLRHVGEEGLDIGGSQLPVPQVGPSIPAADPGQEDGHQLFQNVSAFGGTPGDDGRSGISGSLSRIESTDSRPESRPVAVADQYAQRSSLRTAPLLVAQRDMDGPWGHNEAAYPGTISAGHSDPEAELRPERPRQGQEQGTPCQTGDLTSANLTVLIYGLCGLRLANAANICYANSSFYCLLWTLLGLQAPCDEHWGKHFAELTGFFHAHANEIVSLTEMTWFGQLLHNWGTAGSQKDSAEFAQRLLAWLNSSAFDMRWERRLDTGGTCTTMDSGCTFSPIMLQITHAMQKRGTCSLTEMLLHWHQEQSMRTALLQAPPCLCLHVDRFYQSLTGEIMRSLCTLDLETEVILPVFTDSNLQCDRLGYVPIAGISHQGQDQAGHCRAILKLQPTISKNGTPMKWLLTEDAQTPEGVWQIPPWFQETVTVIWLVRTDCLQVPAFMERLEQAATDTEGHTTDQDLLQLLQAQPGIE